MKNISNSILSLIGFLLVLNIYTFATDRIRFPYLVFYIIILGILIFLTFIRNLKFSYEILIPISIVIYLFFSLLYSYDLQRTFRAGLFTIVFLIIHFILVKENIWHSTFFKSLFLFSIIIVGGTYLSFLFPDVYKQIVFPLFDIENQILIGEFIRRGSHTGFTNQTAANGFLISVGIGLLFARIYSKIDSMLSTKILIIFYFIALFMTMKRSFILANIASILVLIYIKISIQKNKINTSIKMITSIVVVILVLSIISPFIPSIESTISRFKFTETGIDTSGRDKIYHYGFKMFMMNPILGHGLDTVPSFFANNFGLDGLQQMHNIYLQLLAETGIFVFLFIMILFARIYISTYRTTKAVLKINNNNNKFILSFSLYVQTFWLIYGFFGNPLTEHVFLLIYLLFSAISLFYSRDMKRKKLIIRGIQ